MGLEARDFFLELIDPFLERPQGEFSNMLARGWTLLGLQVELF